MTSLSFNLIQKLMGSFSSDAVVFSLCPALEKKIQAPYEIQN